MVSAVSATVITVNSAATLWQTIEPWMPLHGQLGAFFHFWLLFALCVFLIRFLMHRLLVAVKGEKLHWLGQSFGLALGLLRGAWWVAFSLVALVATGIPYLQKSTQERSLIASRLVEPSRYLITNIADRFPGAVERGDVLIPSLTAEQKRKGRKRS